MVQGWPLGSPVTMTGCTGIVSNGYIWGSTQGVSGISITGCSIVPIPKVKLEVGKLYKCKQPISYTLNKSPDTCIKVFGPIKIVHGVETVRVKYWDAEFNEWDMNVWVNLEQNEGSVEEIGRLEALVVYGAVG